MKKGKYIILLSAIVILILIGIETLLVMRIYRLQAEKFDYRYREILQKGLDFIEGRPNNLGLNDSYLLMEGLSAKLLDIYNNKEIDTLSYRKIALRQFHSILVNKQELDVYLTEYLQKRQEDTDFKSHFFITNISLYNVDEIVDLYHAKSDSSWIYRDTLKIPSRLLPVYHYSHSGDRFEIGFNYFVDFSNKKAIVLREITGSLLFSVLAIISIGLMFLYTLRNLMEERRLSELKTDFINNMTHELKTPLSTISIATRTLENDSILSDKEKARQTVSVIHRQNRQLSRQINHLLEISMWERKQFSLDRKTVDLGPFFSGIAESFRWECKDKKCRITEEYHLKTEKAFLDEVQMTVVLHNLLANACKYNINEPEIGLQVWCDDSLKIAVTDNGIGIGREDQKHIFDKFYRVSTGNIHKVKGLGLGLFYVKQIVEAHGGIVDLSSRPGKGSTFTLNLPVNGKNQNSSR